MLGYDESELLVKKFTDITHTDHVDEERENVKKLSRGELTFYNTVKRYIRKDGGVIWASATVSVVRSDDGTFASFLAVIEDVSDKRELVKTLRESELKYRSLIEEIRDGFFITDAQGTITFANGTLAHLFGYPASAGITGTPFFRYIVPEEEERIGALFRRDIESGKTQDLPIEVNVQRIDGSRFIAEVKAYPILNEGRLVGTRGSIRDISERKRADEAIRLANRKLNLLSSITRHDIRNKLMVIQGFLELSLSEMQSPMLPMYLKKVQESAKTIEEQIGFARDYQDLGIASPKWQEINTVFARASSQCDLQSVEMELQSSGYEIYADPLLEKVFYNLVDNALTHGGHVSSISFSFHESAEGLVIALEDNGEGVRYGDKDRIFLQGFGRKTGLGLFLVSEILSITSITIREVGKQGKGARFEMVVPTGMYRRTPDPV
jgi:PAS domain S-box-containing protein